MARDPLELAGAATAAAAAVVAAVTNAVGKERLVQTEVSLAVR